MSCLHILFLLFLVSTVVITYTEGVFLKYGGRAVKKAAKLVKKGPRKDPFEENWKMRGKSLEEKKQRKKKKVTRQWEDYDN